MDGWAEKKNAWMYLCERYKLYITLITRCMAGKLLILSDELHFSDNCHSDYSKF